MYIWLHCFYTYLPFFILNSFSLPPLTSAKPIRTGPASLLSRPGALGMMGRTPGNTSMPRQFVGKSSVPLSSLPSLHWHDCAAMKFNITRHKENISSNSDIGRENFPSKERCKPSSLPSHGPSQTLCFHPLNQDRVFPLGEGIWVSVFSVLGPTWLFPPKE